MWKNKNIKKWNKRIVKTLAPIELNMVKNIN